MKRHAFLIGIILLLASLLRLFYLGKTPISLEWDEVAIGYDAYSILETGRDQFGKFLPITFRSLDDYKPPIYEYITVPVVALFGLSEFSVRLPSAILGIATVGLTYYLTLLIFSRVPSVKAYSNFIAYLSSFLIAISPWHLQFSRAAFEVNVSVFITMLAVYFFIRGLIEPKLFLLSAFFFGLDLFSYHSTRVVAPLLMASLFIIFNQHLPVKRFILLFFLIFGIFFISFIPILISPEAQIRFKATNIFNPGARYLEEKDLDKIFLDNRIQDKNVGFEFAGKIFHNQRLIFTDYDTLKKAFSKYISHFGFEFLFIKGDVPLHHAPGFGLLYLFELPFLIIGVQYLLRKGLNHYTLILPIWLLIVPLPVSVTREAPHAVRSELFLPIFQLFTALGVVLIFNFVRHQSRWFFITYLIVIVMLLSINHAFYLHQYYVHTNYELSRNWMYGRKEAVELTEKIKNNYEKVLVSLRVDMPHIFWLFYTKYPPNKYLLKGGTSSGGFEEKNHFDKYEFRYFNYYSEEPNNKILMVGAPNDFPQDANVIKTIYYLDGTEALKIVENRQK